MRRWIETLLDGATLGQYGQNRKIQSVAGFLVVFAREFQETVKRISRLDKKIDEIERINRDRFVFFETALEGSDLKWKRTLDQAVKRALLEAVRQTETERKKKGFAVCKNLEFPEAEDPT